MTTTEQAIKERPLLMKGELVRATMEGRKTQTRRLIKPQPVLVPASTYPVGRDLWCMETGWGWNDGETPPQAYLDTCPHGRVGDRLWVRETYGVTDYEYPGPFQNRYLYRADGERGRDFLADYRWYPSIHMPREACRLVLEITDVRAERLQQISEWDARDEGISTEMACDYWLDGPQYVAAFAALWDQINAARGFGWDVNPWVWVIRYKVVTP